MIENKFVAYSLNDLYLIKGYFFPLVLCFSFCEFLKL